MHYVYMCITRVRCRRLFCKQYYLLAVKAKTQRLPIRAIARFLTQTIQQNDWDVGEHLFLRSDSTLKRQGWFSRDFVKIHKSCLHRPCALVALRLQCCTFGFAACELPCVTNSKSSEIFLLDVIHISSSSEQLPCRLQPPDGRLRNSQHMHAASRLPPAAGLRATCVPPGR